MTIQVHLLNPQFQHTAARRRLGFQEGRAIPSAIVSTHSRPKAAGRSVRAQNPRFRVSTHSRPKAAGFCRMSILLYAMPFQHTAARRRLGREALVDALTTGFQHTAARRRLVLGEMTQAYCSSVSTHSRPKAAG